MRKNVVNGFGKTWLDITDVVNWRGAVTGVQRVNLMYAFWGAMTRRTLAFSFDSELGVFQTYHYLALLILRQKLKGSKLAGFLWLLYRTAKLREKVILHFLARVTGFKRSLFVPGDRVIFAGVYWQEAWLRSLTELISLDGIRLEFVICDMIPFLKPEYMPIQITAPFREATLLAIKVASRIFAISQNTKRDIEVVCRAEGYPVPSLAVLRLGDDFGAWFGSTPVAGLESEGFVLSVGTIEIRKNYLRLIRAWKKVVDSGKNRGRKLVICGRPGWYADVELKILETEAEARQLVWLKHSNDAELNWLYRNCSFFVYPSLYEGWGLPVAEALVHGKSVLASETSSIPEISEQGIKFFDPESIESIQGALQWGFSNQSLTRLKGHMVSWQTSFSDLMLGGQ